MVLPFIGDTKELKRDQGMQRILEIVIDVMLILVLILLAMRPAVGSILNLRGDLQEISALSNRLQQKVDSLSQAEAAVDQLREQEDLLKEALPLEPKQFDLLNQVQLLAGAEAISVEQLFHKAGDPGKVEFNVAGTARYEQIVSFIQKLENMPRLVQVTSVSVTQIEDADQADPLLSFSIIGVGYHYIEPVALFSLDEETD